MKKGRNRNNKVTCTKIFTCPDLRGR